MNLADELECYSKIMHNAYLLVTEQKSIDELDLDITSADATVSYTHLTLPTKA